MGKTNWGRTLRRTVNDVVDKILCNKNAHPYQRCINPAARICIYCLMGITLIFSGIGIFSWIIICMLLIILQFV